VVSEELPEAVPALVELAPALAKAEEIAEPLPPIPEEPIVPPPVVAKPRLRFAEDLLAPAPVKKSSAKPEKKRKKGARERRGDEDGIRLRKSRRLEDISTGDDEEY